jgi:hypothetical protein
MKNIKIYIHTMDLPKGREILEEQIKLLDETGLFDVAQEVNIMMHFKEENYKWLEDKLANRQNVLFHLFDENYKEWYEATTMQHIQESCHSTDETYYVLVMTCKGISHGEGGHQNWRKYMQHYCVEKWKECVEKLEEGYDTVGAAYLPEPPYAFYPGTFWWANSSYIRKCRRLLSPPQNNYLPQFEGQPHHRYDLECWIGSGNPKWYEMNPGPSGRWYAGPPTIQKNIWTYNTVNAS